MGGQLTVEPSQVRAWSRLVSRAGDDCTALEAYLARCVPDGDLGVVFSPLREAYEHAALQVRLALRVEGERLRETGHALRAVASRYEDADERAAARFGSGSSRRLAPGDAPFADAADATPVEPTCVGEQLPRVTFGWGYDQANAVLMRLGVPDLRRTLTDCVDGDSAKALAQASAWEESGRALLAVRANLVHGTRAVSRTWHGACADAALAHLGDWAAALDRQAAGCRRVASHLRDAVAQAVDVAQLVADTILFIIATVAAGIGFASIPIFGQVRAIETARDVLRLVWDVKKVLAVFWAVLVGLKDAILGAVDGFTADSLPPAPHLPA